MLCVRVISQFAAVGQCRRDLRDRRDRRAADHQIECFSSSPQLSRSRHEKRENQVKIWLYPYCIYILLPFIAIYCRFPAIYRRFPPLLTVPAFIKRNSASAGQASLILNSRLRQFARADARDPGLSL